MTLNSIKRLYKVIYGSVFMTTGSLDYDRVTDAIISLANAVHDYDGDTDDLWYIGEDGLCCLSEFIVGAYWHYTECHSGQWSKGYQALSTLSMIFSPRMSSLDHEAEEYEAYSALNDIAGLPNIDINYCPSRHA
jgi:hypothetical protein